MQLFHRIKFVWKNFRCQKVYSAKPALAHPVHIAKIWMHVIRTGMLYQRNKWFGSFIYNNLPNTALTPYPCALILLFVLMYMRWTTFPTWLFFISLIHQREFHEQKLHSISFTSRSLAEVYVLIVKDLYSIWYLVV